MKQLPGQLNLFDYTKELNMQQYGCGTCLCWHCLYWQSMRCPYGSCWDDYRAKTNPYDKAHPDKSPRTQWSNWKTEQAYWCRGGVTFPVHYCEKFVRYQGQKVQDCLEAVVCVFQDGYIRCSLVDSTGCEECYRLFLERENEQEL